MDSKLRLCIVPRTIETKTGVVDKLLTVNCKTSKDLNDPSL